MLVRQEILDKAVLNDRHDGIELFLDLKLARSLLAAPVDFGHRFLQDRDDLRLVKRLVDVIDNAEI